MTTTETTVGEFFTANRCTNVHSATSGMQPVAINCRCGRWIDADKPATGCTLAVGDGEIEFVCAKCSATLAPTDAGHRNRGCDWSVVWDACASTVFDVVTEEGYHVGAAKVRHLHGTHWLYTDDQCGYSIEQEVSVTRWHLRPESD